jgi:hypothetical protein
VPFYTHQDTKIMLFHKVKSNSIYHINGKPDYQITRLPDYHIISILIIFVFVLILNFIISIAIYNNCNLIINII